MAVLTMEVVEGGPPPRSRTCTLDPFRCFEGSPRSRRRTAPCPRNDILFQPDWARAEPRDGLRKVWSLRIARRCALADAK
jgi:hypothetical protein